MNFFSDERGRKPELDMRGVIRRNTLLFALAQAVASGGISVYITLGPLIMVGMAGNIAFAGLTRGIIEAFRMAMAYPAGRLMDTHGRRPMVVVGFLLLSLSAVLVYFSVASGSLPLMIGSLVVAGLGFGPVNQIRVAATDMYPPQRKAEGIAYILTASTFGGYVGSAIISFGVNRGGSLGMDPNALPWLIVSAMTVASMAFVVAVRPDPREIAREIEAHHTGPVVDRADPAGGEGGEERRLGALLRSYPVLVAMISYALTYGNMAMIMGLTSIVMQHHGIGVEMISLAIAIHIMGMFGLSIPIGRAADRWGRKKVLMLAVAASGLSGLAATATSDYLLMTASLFVVGLAWSAATLASTALIGDLTRHDERGGAIGANEAFAGTLNVSLPILGGVLIQLFGLLSLGITALLLSLPVMALLVRLRDAGPEAYRAA